MRLLRELSDTVKANYKTTEKNVMRRVQNTKKMNTFVGDAEAHFKSTRK